MHVKKNDKVIIITGKDKGKSGKVVRVFPSKDKVIVSGINISKKHQKAKSQEQKGGIIEIEMPIHASNVALVDAKKSKSQNTKSKQSTKNKNTK